MKTLSKCCTLFRKDLNTLVDNSEVSILKTTQVEIYYNIFVLFRYHLINNISIGSFLNTIIFIIMLKLAIAHLQRLKAIYLSFGARPAKTTLCTFNQKLQKLHY